MPDKQTDSAAGIKGLSLNQGSIASNLWVNGASTISSPFAPTPFSRKPVMPCPDYAFAGLVLQSQRHHSIVNVYVRSDGSLRADCLRD